MARILVTGGAGYLGAMLVPWLLGRGHKVRVYDTFLFGPVGLPQENGNFAIIKGDIRSRDSLLEACKDQQALIALASISAEEMCRRTPVVASTVNIGGAVNTALCAKESGIRRFIHASTVAGYAPSDNGSIETDRMRPTSIYGWCKWDAERAIRKAYPAAVIVRCASVCGYSPRQRFDLTVNQMVHDALRRGAITVNGGNQSRSHVHIQDACDFYALLLDLSLENTAGQIFNLVGENQKVGETARLVADVTGASITVKERTDDRSYSVNGAKARAMLGFMPKRSVLKAVHELKAHFDSDAAGMTHQFGDSMTNPKYMNIADGIV